MIASSSSVSFDGLQSQPVPFRSHRDPLEDNVHRLLRLPARLQSEPAEDVGQGELRLHQSETHADAFARAFRKRNVFF